MLWYSIMNNYLCHQHPIKMLVQVLAILVLIQLPVSASGKTLEGSTLTLAPETHIGNRDGVSRWSCQTLVIVAI